MKQLYSVFVLLFLIAFAGFAQNKASLEVKNFNTQHSKFIQEGSKVQVIKEGRIFKGTLKIISNESILTNSDTIQLSQIQEIPAKTVSRQLGGAALLVPSAFIGGFGFWAVGAGLASADGYGIIAVVFGSPLAAAGVLSYVAMSYDGSGNLFRYLYP